ncbi:hypothetical protein [Micromonospora echinofusca]
MAMRGRAVIGVDVSPKMIEVAHQRAVHVVVDDEVFHVLSVETVRSPRARILAWCRLTDFCRWGMRMRQRLNGSGWCRRCLGSPCRRRSPRCCWLRRVS